jgi:hypothetical protein
VDTVVKVVASIAPMATIKKRGSLMKLKKDDKKEK